MQCGSAALLGCLGNTLTSLVHRSEWMRTPGTAPSQTCFGEGIIALMASRITQRSGREATMPASCGTEQE